MPTILVASLDQTLISAVFCAGDDLPDCDFRSVDGLQQLAVEELDSSIAVIILHIGTEGSERQVDSALQQLAARRPNLSVLLIFDDYDAQRELRYRRMGVRECLTRPLDIGRLTYHLNSLTLRQRMEEARNRPACPAYEQAYALASPAFRPVLKQALRIASRDVPVLLSGETGVGKSYLAGLIHQASRRASRPFLSVNCGALPTTLIESELFGHRRGAFTGADENRVGKFAHVDDGTLLLDEIDALSLPAQAKLLRVLDQGVFEQVGSNESQHFGARLIAASNRMLEDLIEKDLFRADLYYRLNVVQLHVPPLRERLAELRPLVHHFLQVLAEKHQVCVPRVEREVWQAWERHRWPGNVRELRNVVERAIALCDGDVIRLRDLPGVFHSSASSRPVGREPVNIPAMEIGRADNALARARQEGEYRHLIDVLAMCGNNRSRAARELGISRTALYKKLVSFGLT